MGTMRLSEPHPTISCDKNSLLDEIKGLLLKYVGGIITFHQFCEILKKDNSLGKINRCFLLERRKKFFPKGIQKRPSAYQIRMPMDGFIIYLDSLSKEVVIDLLKFKRAVEYYFNVDQGYLLTT